MLKFVLKKLLGIIPTLLVIIFLCFLIMQFAPGSPFDSDKPIDPQIKEKLMQTYHLDKPFYIQAYYYLLNLMKGNLGPSLKKRDLTVNQYIRAGFPKSLLLGSLSLFLALGIGTLLGVLAAIKKNTFIDYILTSVSIIGISVPLFVVGPLLQYFISIKWGLLSTSGWITERGGWTNLIMPMFCLSLPYISSFTRIIRASMLETINSDYVRTARSKGLSFQVIIRKHVLRGAILPIISYLGPAFAGIVAGSIVIEKIFRIAGMGTFIVEAALSRDYPVLMGGTLVYAVALLIANLISEVIYKFLDPRV